MTKPGILLYLSFRDRLERVSSLRNLVYETNVNFDFVAGKTFWIARLVAMLAHFESGKILVTAPTNYATDGLMLALNSIASKAVLSMRILRLYSNKRELNPEADLTPSGDKCILYIYLHSTFSKRFVSSRGHAPSFRFALGGTKTSQVPQIQRRHRIAYFDAKKYTST